MEHPWFKRSLGFGYRPVRKEGVILLMLMATIFFGGAFLWMDERFEATYLKDVGFTLAVFSAIIGHIIIYIKSK